MARGAEAKRRAAQELGPAVDRLAWAVVGEPAPVTSAWLAMSSPTRWSSSCSVGTPFRSITGFPVITAQPIQHAARQDELRSPRSIKQKPNTVRMIPAVEEIHKSTGSHWPLPIRGSVRAKTAPTKNQTAGESRLLIARESFLFIVLT